MNIKRLWTSEKLAQASSPPLVAVHGIQGTNASWDLVAAYLRDTYQLILPNLPGRGLATLPVEGSDCGLLAYARAIDEVIVSEIGTAPYALAGWSMGTSVTLEYLLSDDRLSAHRRMPSCVILLSGTAQLDDVEWFISESDEALLEEIRARELRLELKNPADAKYVSWTWKQIRKSNQLELLKKIDIPTLIIHGSNDEDCPVEHAFRMHQEVTNSEIVILPYAKHSILTQNASEVGDAIKLFLAKHMKAA